MGGCRANTTRRALALVPSSPLTSICLKPRLSGIVIRVLMRSIVTTKSQADEKRKRGLKSFLWSSPSVVSAPAEDKRPFDSVSSSVFNCTDR